MDTKHTPGPLKVVMQSTCSAAWPAIVQVCIDPATGEEWEREIGEAGTSHLETAHAHCSNEFPAGYDEAPHRFELHPDGEEAIANATLWAAAPDLLAVAQNFQITGPDDDGLMWLVLHGNGTTGRAIFNLGSKDQLAGKVAAVLEEDRRAAIAKATGEQQ